MENLLLQTKEYVKELMVYRFKSVIPSLEKTDNFPILVNDFMDKGILLWLWICFLNPIMQKDDRNLVLRADDDLLSVMEEPFTSQTTRNSEY